MVAMATSLTVHRTCVIHGNSVLLSSRALAVRQLHSPYLYLSGEVHVHAASIAQGLHDGAAGANEIGHRARRHFQNRLHETTLTRQLKCHVKRQTPRLKYMREETREAA